MNVRNARPDESDALSALARSSKALWGYSAQQLAAWSDELRITRESIARWPTFVVDEGAGPVGVAQLNTTAVPWALECLWVHPSAVGRGIGRLLLGHLIAHARAHGQSALAIDADPNAEAFYRRLGARRVGEVAAPVQGQPDRTRPQLVLSVGALMPGRHDTAAPPLRTGALLLRHFTLDDTAAIFRLSQEQGLRDWLPDQVYADEEEARQVLHFLIAQYGPEAHPRDTPCVLAVCLAATDEVIGHVGFSPCEHGVEVGYAIGDAHQGRGHARQALLAACAWAIPRFGLAGVHAIVAAENVGSCKVLQACGFGLLATAQRRLHGVPRTVRTYRLEGIERCDVP